MTLQPDKLFRDHLDNFQKPAPASAWERIESGLERRHLKMLWLKVAASILIIIASTILFWPKQDVSSLEIASPGDVHPMEKQSTSTPLTESSPIIVTVEKPTQKLNEKSNLQKPTPQAEEIIPDAEDLASTEISPEPELLPISESPVSEPQMDSDIVNAPVVGTGESNIKIAPPQSTLVYSLEEVNSKFVKKVVPGNATMETKNTSGIQKVLYIAYELKHDSNFYGDLRERKNELLSFSFLDDKQGAEK